MRWLPQWLRKSWHDPVGSQLISYGLIALFVLLAGSVPAVRAWALERLNGVSRLQVIGWFALGVTLGATAVSVLLRQQRKQPIAKQAMVVDGELVKILHESKRAAKPFAPITVIDDRHEIEWQVKHDPAGWLNGSPNTGEVDTILDGPFHAEPTCRARLDTSSQGGSRWFSFEPVCPRCHARLFVGPPPIQRAAKSDVIEELRRIHRLGMPLDRPTVLEHARYWNDIRPYKR